MPLLPCSLTFEASNLVTVCTSKLIAFTFFFYLFLALDIWTPHHFGISVNLHHQFCSFKFLLIFTTKLFYDSLIRDCSSPSGTSAVEFLSCPVFRKLCHLICTEALFANNSASTPTSLCLLSLFAFRVTNLTIECF